MKWTRIDGNRWISGNYRITRTVMAGDYKNFTARSTGDRLVCETATLAAAKDWCEQQRARQYLQQPKVAIGLTRVKSKR
jgi:hypothetical protein